MCKLVYTLYTDKYKTLLRKTKEHVKKKKKKKKKWRPPSSAHGPEV